MRERKSERETERDRERDRERERESKRDERESMTVYRNADNEIQLVKSERGINDL